MEPFITVDSVRYTYPLPGDKAGRDTAHPALTGLSLHIPEGEYLAVVGANGSGKSTLARHLNALLLPDSGSIHVGGLDTREPRRHPEIRRLVGMVFQRPEDQVVATLVEDDIAFGLESLGVPNTEIRARVDKALHDLDLWEHRQRPPHMLSAGQLQRLALAGVLAMQPRCIVFDEVTAMLDPAGRRAVRALLHDLHAQGLTLVLITHLMEEALAADRVVVLDRGQVALEGTPVEIFKDAERLHALGLDLPPASHLARALMRRIRQPEPAAALAAALTVADVVEALELAPRRGPEGEQAAPAPVEAADRVEENGNVLIQAHDLGHVYMAGTPFDHRALWDTNIAIRTDAPHGLIGATGSGKSTLLQHLNGLLRPQEGQVWVDGHELGNPNTDLQAIRRTVGLVFQLPETQIFEQYVGDEIAYGPRLAGLSGQPLRERVRWAMKLVGLDFETFKDRYTFALSGGEKRKVALAAMLALQPRALLLDEPTAGLDPASRREILAHFKTLQETGMVLAISSHRMEDIADLVSELTVMAGGTSVAAGPVTEIFARREDLLAWGLDQPVAAQIGQALRDRGWPVPAGILDEDRLVDSIARCLESAS